MPVELVGRKAAALGQLIEAGFPVPLSVCITTEAFHDAGFTSAENLRLPDGLLDALSRLLTMNAPLAVRSSAVMEDLPEASLAGRYTTRLNVTGPAAIEQAVLDCWRSYWNIPDANQEGGMAVLIQPFLDAECAGVCFTVDPVRQRPDQQLIVSAWGLGSGVVGGSVPTDIARLRRSDLGVEDFTVADKLTALHPTETGGGVTSVPVPDELRAIACLPESWLQRVGQFGLAIEQVFGAPQDMEWAVANRQLWILQSRTITALPVEIREAARFPITWDNEDEPRHYWWLERARDSAGSPLLPAELDFVRINTQGGHDAVRYAGYPQTRWRKYINGRVYMAAAKSPNSPGHVRVYSVALRELYERLAQQDVTNWEHWGPEIVRAVDHLAAFENCGADGPALADHLEDAIATATRHWMIHTMSPRPIRSAALLDLYIHMTGKQPEVAAADIPFLLAGAETVQTRLVEALYELACLALDDPKTAQAVPAALWAGQPLNGSSVESFARAFTDLMSVYGGRLCYRPVSGYPVELPFPWREAPQHVWEMIAAYMPWAGERDRPDPRQAREQAHRAAKDYIERLCADAPDPALVPNFRRTLDYAQRNAASLDDQNHYIDQLSEGETIQALLYAGRWLAEQGQLDNAYDVFWFKADEVLNALRGSSSGFDKILVTRRAEYKQWQTLVPPACLGLPDPVLPARPKQDPIPPHTGAVAAELPVNAIAGEPASRGRATGRAHILYEVTNLTAVVPGDVLVIPYVDTALIPILPTLTALVLDYGSPGDHAAITAREFGLPTVCNTLHGTHRIPENAWVTVDAHTGRVTWETKGV